MPTTYAAYYNIQSAVNASSSMPSTKPRQSSTSSTQSRISIKKALNALGIKHADQKQEVTPSCSGLTKRDRPLFGRSRNAVSAKGESDTFRRGSLTKAAVETVMLVK